MNRTSKIKLSGFKFFLLFAVLMLFIAGCGDDKKDPPVGSPVPTIQGTALIPSSSATQKIGLSKPPLGRENAFVGSKVRAWSLSTGIAYDSFNPVDANGNYTIKNIPFGGDYFIRASKGDQVADSLVTIPGNARMPFEIGQIDLSTTVIVKKVQDEAGARFLNGGIFNRDMINLIHSATREGQLAALRVLVEDVVDDSGKINGDADLNAFFKGSGGEIDEEKIASINIYLTLYQLLIGGDPNANSDAVDVITKFITGGSGNIIADKVAIKHKDGVTNVTNVTNVTVRSDNFRDYFHPELTETTITGGPSNPTTDDFATFFFISNKVNSTFECKLDGLEDASDLIDCTHPVDFTLLGLGEHTFRVRATDPSGAVDPSPASHTWMVLPPDNVSIQTFEDGTLEGWVVGGRQITGSSNSSGVSEHAGSKMAFLTHKRFTELNLTRKFEYTPGDILKFDAEFSINGDTSPSATGGSNFYSMVEYALILHNANGDALRQVNYRAATTTFPYTETATFPSGGVIEIKPNGLQHYVHNIAQLASDLGVDINDVAAFSLIFNGYSSWWSNDTMTIRFDNVSELISQDESVTTPTLVAPINNAAIPQNDSSTGCALHEVAGFGTQIHFDWTDASSPNGILRYHIIAEHIGSSQTFVDKFVTTSEFTKTFCGGFMADARLNGWTWRVQAEDTLHNFSAWNETGTFHFEPCRFPDGRKCGASPIQQRKLTVTKDTDDTGTGTVTSSPAGINCGLDCDELYDVGKPVTLTATPADDSFLVSWTGGGCSGTGTPCTVTMDTVQNIIVKFNVVPLPKTIIDSGPPSLTNLSSAIFTFHTDQTGTTSFECTRNTVTEPCSTGKLYSGLSDGEHTFRVKATVDGVPGLSSSPWKWTVDTTPPDTVIDSAPSNPSLPPTATFHFHATGLRTSETATFECELRKGTVVVSALSSCTNPKTYDGLDLSPPDYHFEVKATDEAGNTDLSPALHDWAITNNCIFCEDFEGGIGAWFAETGVWQVGAPTSGTCFGGSGQCAATVLNGNYPTLTDSRLISEGMILPLVAGNEEIHLRFIEWFSYGGGDWGWVQVQIFDPSSGWPATWTTEGTFVETNSGGWTSKDVDLTAYAGKTIRIAFGHNAVNCCAGADEGQGWFIDDIKVEKKIPEFTGDFETGTGDWYADRGVWQVGTPTDGPAGCFNGSRCAGTRLAGNYPTLTDSRLISPSKTLETVGGTEEIHLRFRNWFSYGGGDWGWVQVKTLDSTTGLWSAWKTEGNFVETNSGGWTLKDVDLTAYAGKTIRIAFGHNAVNCCAGADEGSGWYIDDIQFVKKAPVFTGDFEAGIGDWLADRGVWQVGTPTAGPGACFTGSTKCAGTVLNGSYPTLTDSRLISPTKTLETVAGTEEIHLRFRNWFSYGGGDWGWVQVQALDSATGLWSAWTTEGNFVETNSGGWTLKDVDLTAYAGQTIRIAFSHNAVNCCAGADEGSGWYIDDIQFVKKTPVFTGDFEAGIGDWFADRGVWQIGTPTAGPGSCFTGSAKCAGTVLNGSYPTLTDSKLINNAAITLPVVTGFQTIRIRFENWFSYGGGDWGQVQIQVFDSASNTWGIWTNKGTAGVNASGGWTTREADLGTALSGQTIRVAFSHNAVNCCAGADEGHGWFIDNVRVVVQ